MISDIEVKPIEGHNTLKARGRFTVSNAFRINFTVMQGTNGLFVGFPGRRATGKDGNEKFYTDVFCEDKSVYQDLQTKVLEQYNSVTGGSLDQGEGATPDDQNVPF